MPEHAHKDYMKPTISLKTLLAGLLALSFLLLGLTLFLANLSGTRDFLQRQLVSHAQGTANTLARQLSNEPDATASRVDGLFDNGYYQRITLSQPDGTILLESAFPMQVDGVPDWFVRMLPLDVANGQAEALSDGKRTIIQISSHPGFAYQQMWIIARNTLWLTLLFLTIATLLGAALLARALAPLRKMEQLALKAAEGEFTRLDPLPRVRELHHISLSLNRMSDVVGRMLVDKSALVQKLQADLYQDPHTGLANRAFFLPILLDTLNEHGHTCGLILLQVDGLNACNSRLGREAGDRLIRAVAAAIRTAETSPGERLPADHVARIDGAQFGVILEYADADTLLGLADKLAHAATLAIHETGLENCCAVYAGAALAEASHTTPHEITTVSSSLLTRADSALRDAKLGPSGSSRLAAGVTPATDSLRTLMRQAVQDAQLSIEWQPVLRNHNGGLDHIEAHARLTPPNGSILPAGAFVYLAEEVGRVTTLDKLILTSAWTAEHDHPVAARSVNLSVSSLQDSAFVEWLKGFVPSPERLYLELPAHRLATTPNVQQTLLNLRQCGFGIVLDRFVPQAHTLTCLHDIRPHWVKVEGSLCRQAKDSVGTRALLKALCEYAHELGCKVGATGIEHDDELAVLYQLGFDAAQGQLFKQSGNDANTSG
jgi:diguanylate cyclase (GGDEF)-like protein